MAFTVKFEEPLSIKKAQRPVGYGGEYLFVETPQGELWKARVIPRANGGSHAVSITVSQVDEEGRALQRGGEPMVSEPETHIFTEADTSTDDFDLENRIMRIVEARVSNARIQFNLVDRLKAVTDKLTKPDTSEEPIEQEIKDAD